MAITASFLFLVSWARGAFAAMENPVSSFFQVPTSGTCWSLGQLLLPEHTPMRLMLRATGPALVEKVQVPSHQLMGEPIVDALPLRKR